MRQWDASGGIAQSALKTAYQGGSERAIQLCISVDQDLGSGGLSMMTPRARGGLSTLYSKDSFRANREPLTLDITV